MDETGLVAEREGGGMIIDAILNKAFAGCELTAEEGASLLLEDAGLGPIPGTSAEILNDHVRFPGPYFPPATGWRWSAPLTAWASHNHNDHVLPCGSGSQPGETSALDSRHSKRDERLYGIRAAQLHRG